MQTITRSTFGEYGPRWHAAARAIPATIPHPQLRDLQSRYEDTTNTVVAAMPSGYRRALLIRIHALLAASAPVEPEGSH